MLQSIYKTDNEHKEILMSDCIDVISRRKQFAQDKQTNQMNENSKFSFRLSATTLKLRNAKF